MIPKRRGRLCSEPRSRSNAGDVSRQVPPAEHQHGEPGLLVDDLRQQAGARRGARDVGSRVLRAVTTQALSRRPPSRRKDTGRHRKTPKDARARGASSETGHGR